MRRAQFAFDENIGSSARPRWSADLEALLRCCEGQSALLDPDHFAQRMAVLDRLEAILDLAGGFDATANKRALLDRAQALAAQFEVANAALFASLRCEIQSGHGHAALGPWLEASDAQGGEIKPGLSYDWWDDLVAGILELKEPERPPAHPGGEMVFYQPTPARHIFEMLRILNLGAEDVLVDLGSGLGHVPLLTGVATLAQCIGIEREPAYIACARKGAAELRLTNVQFVEEDVRRADLSHATIFYLYTPFTGTLLREVLDRLRDEARSRTIRIAAFGPCVEALATEDWLAAQKPPQSDRIAVFRSRG